MASPLLRRCTHPECAVLTMGELCIEHEEPVTRVFPRGRPYVEGHRRVAALAALRDQEPRAMAELAYEPEPSGLS